MGAKIYNLSVLVVDDDKNILYSLNKALEKRVKKLFFAEDGLEALEVYKENKCDVILTDVYMPRMNGIGFIREVRSFDSNVPIILLTGETGFDVLSNAINLDVSLFLQKPINLRLLFSKLKQIDKIKSLEEEVASNQKLLKQYKDVVDSSSIVSKTDAKGIITYVNKEFCKISGYSEEELLGKPHNIVRHPDNPESFFSFIWYTIKDLKESWSGEVKNLSKDGTPYWVKATITPILDDEGNVLEYIGIRTDITQQVKIKEYFENQLNISSKQFNCAMNLSKEYERAINESNILTRYDLDRNVTFLNEKFLEVTGYSKEELIGKSYMSFQHDDMPKEIYEQMWSKIENGETWNGILKNKAKNGEPYWVDSTVVPIKDERGEIVEYMAIRHDLTELFNLHKEIEDTQREVIYKMGEIGETRSKETGNHVKRVAEYSKLLAILYGLSTEEADILYTASPMHDIGKVGIPDSILKKPGKLTDEEYKVMKTHSIIGKRILKGSTRPVLKAATIVAYEHHEKWDGTGYPRGIKGEKIHIYGRITAVADVFDALGSDRVYKKAWSLDKILNLLKEEKGKHFEPKLIDLFLDNLDSFLEIRDKFRDKID